MRLGGREVVGQPAHEQPVGAALLERHRRSCRARSGSWTPGRSGSARHCRCCSPLNCDSQSVNAGVQNASGTRRAAELLGEVGQALVEPGVLGGAAADQHVLIEADHVLELVDEHRRQRGSASDSEMVQLGVMDPARGRRRSRRRSECAWPGSRSSAEEEAEDDAAGGGAVGRQLVDGGRQQHDDDAVAVEVGFAAERGGVDGIEMGVEQRADAWPDRRRRVGRSGVASST